MCSTSNTVIFWDTPLLGVYGYDIVYSVTQDIVNFQFKFLHATYIPGTKATYIPQTIDTRPKPGGPGLWGALGAPYVSISIGTDTNYKNIRLFLPVMNGNVAYRDENDDLYTLAFDSWTLSFLVNIGKAQITPQNINTMPVIDSVKQQLKELPSNIFQPYSLFLDLANADIVTSLQVTGVDFANLNELIREEVTFRLTFYFSNLKGTNNPYIVGYPVSSRNPAVTDPLPMFAPTNVNFSTTPNTAIPSLSTLNYLITVNSHTPPTDPRAGIFPASAAVVGTQGFSLISADLFVNQYVVGTFLKAVQGALHVPEYFIAGGTNSWNLTHAPSPATVQVGTDSGWVPINLKSAISTTCTAVLTSRTDQVVLIVEGEFSCQLDWSEDWGALGTLWLASLTRKQPFTISLAFSGGTEGRIDVAISVVQGTPYAPDPSYSAVAKISDAILAVFNGSNGIQHGASITSMLIANLENAELTSLSTNITAAINVLSKRVILPAGEIFSVASLHLDSSNNLVSRLTYNDSLSFHAHPAPPQPPVPPPFVLQKAHPSLYSTTVTVPLTTKRKLTNLAEIQNATITQTEQAAKAGLDRPASPVTEVQDSVQVIVSSELMYQTVSATALDPTKRLQAVYDSLGNPILFSIGTDNLFYATYSTPQTSGSSDHYKSKDESAQWSSALVMPTLKGLENASAQAFGATQNPTDGSIYLVLAVTNDADRLDGDSHLFVKPSFLNDVTKVNWPSFGSTWVERPRPKNLQGDKIPIDELFFGMPSVNGNALPLLIASTRTVTGTDHRFATHYLINADTAIVDPASIWTEYLLPNDAAKILDLAVGNHPIGDIPNSGFETRGTYTLYQTAGGETVLNFTTLLDPTFHSSFHFQMSVPSDTRTICAVTDTDSGFTDIYIGGGTQLAIFPAYNQLSGSTPTPVATIANVSELAVSNDGGVVSIWALDASNALWRLQSNGLPSGPSPVLWTIPLIIRSDIAQLTPLYNSVEGVQELIVVDAKTSQLSHLIRDPISTSWTQYPMAVKALNKVLTFPSYTTQIRMTDVLGKALPGQSAQLSADQFVPVAVNGEAYNIGSKPVTVLASVAGKVTILQPVTSIESPNFHLTLPNSMSSVIINPSAQVTDKLFSVKTKEDLQNAKDTVGRPVFSGFSDDKLNPAISVINRLSAHRPANNPRAALSSSAGTAFKPVSIGTWGLSFRFGTATFVEGSQARNLFNRSQLSSPGYSAPSFGDLCEWFLNTVEEAFDIAVDIVDGVLTIAATIASEVIKFAISSFYQFLKATAVFVGKILGIDVSGFLAWLGAVFDWDEILRTGKCYDNLITTGLEQLEIKVQGLEPIIRNSIDKVKKNLREHAPQVQINSVTNTPLGIPPQVSQLGPDAVQALSLFLDNPIIQFIEDKILNNGILSAFDGTPLIGPLADITQILNNFMTNVVQPALDDLYRDGQITFDDLKVLLTNAGVLEGLPLLQILERVGIDVAILMLDTAEVISIALLEIAVDILKAIGVCLISHLNVPFFTALWEDLTGSDFSLGSLLSLLVALPIHTSFAAATGTSRLFPTGFESFSYSQLEHFFGLSVSKLESSVQLGNVDLHRVQAWMPAVNAGFSALYDLVTAYSLWKYQTAPKLASVCVLLVATILGAGCAFTAVPEFQGLDPSTNEFGYYVQLVNFGLKGIDCFKSFLLFMSRKFLENADPFPEFVGAVEGGLGAMVFIIGLVSGFTGTKEQAKSSSMWTVDGGLDGGAIALAGGSRILSEDHDPDAEIAAKVASAASMVLGLSSIPFGIAGAVLYEKNE